MFLNVVITVTDTLRPLCEESGESQLLADSRTKPLTPSPRKAGPRPPSLSLLPLRRRLALSVAPLSLRGPLQPHRGDFVGVVAELAADGVFGAADLAVEAVFGGGEFVAEAVDGDLALDQGGLLNEEFVVGGGDGLEAEVGVVGGVALDGGEGVEGLDVVVEDLGRDAAAGGVCHVFLRMRVRGSNRSAAEVTLRPERMRIKFFELHCMHRCKPGRWGGGGGHLAVDALWPCYVAGAGCRGELARPRRSSKGTLPRFYRLRASKLAPTGCVAGVACPCHAVAACCLDVGACCNDVVACYNVVHACWNLAEACYFDVVACCLLAEPTCKLVDSCCPYQHACR